MMLEITVARTLGGLRVYIQDNLKAVEIMGHGKGELSWASMNPWHPVVNDIKVSKYHDAYPTLLRLAQERGIKIKDGQTLTFALTDEQKEQIYQCLREAYRGFEQDLLDGQICVHIDQVGVDHPKSVVGISIKEYKGLKAWDIFYNLADKLGMYHYCPGAVGEDITDKFVAEYKRRKDLQAVPKQPVKVRCWECGREFSLEEADRLVKAKGAKWELDGLFYCGC
jgi:hypothetical protein